MVTTAFFWTGQPYGNLDLILCNVGFVRNGGSRNRTCAPTRVFRSSCSRSSTPTGFLTAHRTDRGQTPQDAIDSSQAAFPGFCNVLTVRQAGRLVAFPREEITTTFCDADRGATFMLTAVMSNPIIQPE